jgi:hypothetical protein
LRFDDRGFRFGCRNRINRRGFRFGCWFWLDWQWDFFGFAAGESPPLDPTLATCPEFKSAIGERSGLERELCGLRVREECHGLSAKPIEPNDDCGSHDDANG